MKQSKATGTTFGVAASTSRRPRIARHEQDGMTLVELMVALVISLVIAIAAVAALSASRFGFNTVDAASQLRDNGRFLSDLIQRLAGQSGFRDIEFVTKPRANTVGLAANPRPDVFGFDNGKPSGTPLDIATGKTAHTTGAPQAGSDVLIFAFQISKMFPDVAYPGVGWNTADQSVIDCSGTAPAVVKAPTASEPVPMPNPDGSDRDQRMISILYVDTVDGEPTLMCKTSADNGVTFPTVVPLVQGVENVQVLYGVDAVVAGTAPVLNSDDSVPDSYLRADQLTVPGDDIGTFNNWRRVRSLRIGAILRAKTGSAQDNAPDTTKYLYVFGTAPSSNVPPDGSALNASGDTNAKFEVRNDTRLRQAITFTVYLHNKQAP
jgi:type IV pilus assembly protein PilW